MKKMKLLTPIMASVAVVAPIMTTLTSCGKIDYTQKISDIKDKALTTFIDLTRTTHRCAWVEGECYEYITKKMQALGYDVSGYDKWSTVPEVAPHIAAEKKIWEDAGVETKSAFTEYGNIWYDIPASKGMEDAPKIILHAHMDVSTAFASDDDKIAWAKAKTNIINVTYDRDNEILKTDGKASLGADDGLGIAVMLTLAELKDEFVHGGIRLLFTAGESEGTVNYASGADFLHMDQMHEGKAWESEKGGKLTDESYLGANSSKPFGDKEGEFPYVISTSGIYKNYIYSSCGGIHQCEYSDSNLNFRVSGKTDYENNEVNWDAEFESGQKLTLYKLELDHLHGGQSAKYINSGYANALQMLMDIIFIPDYHCRLFNAYSNPGQFSIASSAGATFATTISEDELKTRINLVVNTYKNTYPNDDWDKFTCELTKIDNHTGYVFSLSPNQTRSFTKLLSHELLYGPVDWFDKDHKTVKTSCNFGKLTLLVNQYTEGNSNCKLYNVCRSADHNSLNLFAKQAHGLLTDAFASFYSSETLEEAWKKASDKTTHNYKPVWEKRDNNKMVNALLDGYKNMGVTPDTWDNHGWLEISCFIETYEEAGWELPYMACLGPEIRNSHEVDEEVWTDTLNQCLGGLLFAIEKIKNY